ncbi:MAG: chromosome segregation protein SMC, partial [Syntrophomonadaceae bacterium]|nr:chromosome segregation protein SMC [Syntrophomonadaceae bacterium]
LAGTGLGKQGYSIISQGELETLLKAQPFERRLLLEEAAGIIKYRQQRDEVQRRILNSHNDLLRLDDLLDELFVRREDLKDKSERAARWIEISAAHSELEKRLLALELVQLEEELDKRLRELRSTRDQLSAAEEEFSVVRQRQEEQQQALEQHIEQTRATELRQKDIENALTAAVSEHRLCEERIKNDQERIRSGREEQEKYRGILAETEEDLQQKQENLRDEKRRLEAREDEYQALLEESERLRVELEEYGLRLTEEKSRVFERAQEEVRLRNHLARLEQELRQAREKSERTAIYKTERENRQAQLEQRIHGLSASYEDDHNEMRKMHLRLNELEEEYRLQQEDMENLRRGETRLDREVGQLDNQLLAIKEQERSYSGYSQSVRDFLLREQGAKKSLPGIRGLAGELITVPAGLETAIEVAMGRSMENIIVDQAVQAQRAIEELKRQHLGRITFLPLDILQANKLSQKTKNEISAWPGVLGVASELIQFDPAYQVAITYLLGRIVVVETLSQGLDIFRSKNFGVRLVTLDGDVLQPSGAMSGGSKEKRHRSPLQRKAEIRQLELQRAKKQKELEKERDAIEALYDSMLDAEGELRELRQRQTELMTRSRITAEQEEQVKQELSGNERDLRLYRRELEDLSKHMEEVAQKNAEAQKTYEKLLEENRRYSEESAETRAVFDQKQRELDIREERARAWQEQLQSRTRELANLTANLEQFEQIRNSCRRSLDEAEQAERELQQDMEEQQLRRDGQQSIIQQREQELRAIRKQREQEMKLENEAREELGELKTLLLRQELSRNELEAAHRSLELKQIRIETELEGQQFRWQEKFAAEEHRVWYEPISVNKAREQRRRMEELAEQLSLLGQVDTESIQEYEHICERVNFLEQQTADVKAAKSGLEKMLKETEKMMSDDFTAFLAAANESFRETFTDIFNGGDANLQVQPGEDEFNDGIELVVKMPGKRRQSLSLLSGGEKALTCIAFLFALLKLNPSPFCVVDEIDAALDESNLLRFTRFIKRMAQDIQFIVITHRQATIEAGQRIYGVTMAEQGVSTVLVLNYEQAQQIAE